MRSFASSDNRLITEGCTADATNPPPSLEIQDVLHIEQTILPVLKKARATKCSLRISRPTAGSNDDLKAFARTGKHHRMLAHDVAAPNRRKTYRLRIAFT